MKKFNERSLYRLEGVDPKLKSVVMRSKEISTVDFEISEGLRSQNRQQQLVEQGKSKTLNSKHLTGHAVDVVVLIDGKANWDLAHYKAVSEAFKQAAKELNVPLVWGGDWKKFIDGPHFQIQL